MPVVPASPSRSATSLSDELRALLAANDVPECVQDEIAKAGFFTTKAFANCVDAPKEVVQFTDATSLPDDQKKATYALLKQAWKEADATVARGIKRLSEGLTDVVMDEALPDTTKLMIHEAFYRRYAWNLEFKLRPSDALLGRVRSQRALDHMREYPDQMFGESLLWALDKFHSVYYTHTKLLYNRSGTSSNSSSIVPAPHQANVVANAKTLSEKRGGQEAKGKPVTALQNDKGVVLCKKFNDRRGCQHPCKDGKSHGCDIMLTNNRVCQQKHPRYEHDPSKHGKPQMRQ